MTGTFRIRQTGYEYVLEELRNGAWIIIESLPTFTIAGLAYDEYTKDGHQVEWAMAPRRNLSHKQF